MSLDEDVVDDRSGWIDFSSARGRALGYIIWCAWALAVSAGVSSMRDDPLARLVPVVSAAVVVSLIIRHFRVPGPRIGAVAAVAGLLLVPALDLLIDPPCESIEYLRLDVRADASVSITCMRTTDMKTEVAAAFMGVGVISGLVWFLIHRRRKGEPYPAAASSE